MKFQFLILNIVLPAILISQVQLDANTKIMLDEIKFELDKNPSNLGELSTEYPLRYMKGEYYISSTARVSNDFTKASLPEGFFSGSQLGSIISLYISVDHMNEIDKLENIEFIQVSTAGSWYMKDAMKTVRADSVHKGLVWPSGITGRNVIIGFPETGIDFTHPVFYDSTLTNLRILAAWDQRRIGGNKPSQGYGAEYVNSAELLAAGSDTFDAQIGAYPTHGTTTASMGAAGGAGKDYFGAAPEAKLLFTAIEDLLPANIIDGWKWMMDKAKAEGKPLIISNSFGGYHWGPLDGTSNLSLALDAMVDSGVVAVTSTSNDGFINFHLMKDFMADTLRTKVDINSYANRPTLYGARLLMWGEANKHYDYWIEVYDNGNLVMSTPQFNTATATSGPGNIQLGSDTVFYILANDAAHPANGTPHVNLRIKNKNTAWDIVLASSADSGRVHYYNLDAYEGNITRRGASLVQWIGNGNDGNSEYCHPDPAVAKKTITTGGFHNSGNSNGQRDINAPSGPTIDGRTKPDIMAVSKDLTVAASSFTSLNLTLVDFVRFKSKTYIFYNSQGNSYTSPVVAGVAALMLEANPLLNPMDIRDTLRLSAIQDSFTGSIPATGSNSWGWGKLNAAAAVRAVIDSNTTVSLGEFNSPAFNVYPNPTSYKLYLQNIPEGKYDYKIFDFRGRTILQGFSEDRMIDLGQMAPGIYILRLEIEGESLQDTFIKN